MVKGPGVVLRGVAWRGWVEWGGDFMLRTAHSRASRRTGCQSKEGALELSSRPGSKMRPEGRKWTRDEEERG